MSLRLKIRLSVLIVGLFVSHSAVAEFVYAYVDSGGVLKTNYGSPSTPAKAMISRDILSTGRNLEFNGAMSMAHRRFESYINVAGDLVATAVGSSGIGGRVLGQVQETLTAGNGGGSGTILLPWHIVGDIETSFSASDGFIPGSFDGGTIRLEILWQAWLEGSSTTIAGQRFNYEFRNSGPVDINIPIAIPVTFGQAVNYSIYFDFNAIFGYSANGTTGLISGYANGLFDHTGTLGPAMVVDTFGNPIADATLVSASGLDYFASTVPLPAMAWPFTILLCAFARRRRSTDSFLQVT